MYIQKSDYITVGVNEETLENVAVDQDGYLQHPPFQIIGNAEENRTLFLEVAEAIGKDAYFSFGSTQIPNWEVLQWFLSKENKSHTWNPKEE